jgi:hypothetical protein
MRRRASAPKRVRRALARDGDHDARLAPLERLPHGSGLTCERRPQAWRGSFAAARLPINILSTPPRPSPTRRLVDLNFAF